VTAWLREEEPDAFGVLVFGSYARGEADPRSDLDVYAVTRTPPRVPYRTRFVDGLHVSAGAATAAALVAERDEPAPWALGFPERTPARWLWSEPAAVESLGDPPDLLHAAAPPELEDFVEAAGKALRADDSLALRLGARTAAEWAVGLLRPLNPERFVASRRDAVRAALALPVAPPEWPRIFLVCLGLEPADDGGVRAAAEELARGLLALLRERAPELDPQPELPRYLADGTLERHLGLA
jgi:phosphoribosyl-AMP cyclohydrolase